MYTVNNLVNGATHDEGHLGVVYKLYNACTKMIKNTQSYNKRLNII